MTAWRVALLFVLLAGAHAAEEKEKEEEGDPERQEEFFCGKQNCYTLLGVRPDATQRGLQKAYRKLSLKYHPDKNKDADAEAKFAQIASAYTILTDEKQRKEYSEYLRDPAAYEFKHRRGAPIIYTLPQASDIRVVLVLVLLLATAVQYYLKRESHARAIESIRKNDRRLQQQARNMAQAELPRGASAPKKGGKKEREMLAKLEGEAMNELCAQLELGGNFAPPKLTDLLVVQLVVLPWFLAKRAWKSAAWWFRHSVLKQEYGPEEMTYLTHSALGLSAAEFASTYTEQQREDLLSRKLWVKENMDEYDDEKSEGGARRKNPGAQKRNRKKAL